MKNFFLGLSKKLLLPIILIVVLWACKEIYNTPSEALLVASISYSDTSVSKTPIVTVYGVGLDSIWINKESVTSIRLPLSVQSSTEYVISLDSIVDTIQFSHDNELKYESIKSGFYYEHKILEVEHTQNKIDSVVVSDSAVTINWNENIQLYIDTVSVSSN